MGNNSSRLDEIEGMLAETNKILIANNLQFKESNRRLTEQFAETDRRLDARFAETDREIKETSREVKETSRTLKALQKQFGEFGNGIGKVVEGLVLPSILPALQEWGVPVEHAYTNLRSPNGTMEIIEVDGLCIGPRVVVVCSVKSRLTRKKVEDHEKALKRFTRFFPQYRDRTVLGLVAGVRIDKDVERIATSRGLFVMAASSKIMGLLNPPSFKPKEWKGSPEDTPRGRSRKQRR